MLALLGWLPVLGPIVSGITEYLNKKADRELVKYQTDADVTKHAISAQNELTLAFVGDIGVKVCRDIVLAPTSVWFALGAWDKIVANKYPNLVWNVAAFPTGGGLEYLPHACLVFLFGMAWKAMK